MGIFFLGGGVPGGFEVWSLCSHILAQMGQELVRLIDLIHLNMFSTHIVHCKSSENFHGQGLNDPSSKNG